ncbi:MAG: TlpA disulfide reductase family protein, partial [Steroidobacter sp.]
MKRTHILIKSLVCSAVVGLSFFFAAITDAGDTVAPDFSLPTKAGTALKLSQYRGKVVMLNFWASWCVPCRKEMPLMDQIYKKYAPAGF